jgi:hypothetical protein
MRDSEGRLRLWVLSVFSPCYSFVLCFDSEFLSRLSLTVDVGLLS